MLESHELQCHELLESCQSVLSNSEGFERWHGGKHDYGDIHEGGPSKDRVYSLSKIFGLAFSITFYNKKDEHTIINRIRK